MDDLVTVITKAVGRQLRLVRRAGRRRSQSAERRDWWALHAAPRFFPLGIALLIVGVIGFIGDPRHAWLLACAVIGFLLTLGVILAWCGAAAARALDWWAACDREDAARERDHRAGINERVGGTLEALHGTQLPRQHEFKQAVEKAVVASRVEVSVIALLSPDNTVLGTDYRMGTATRVWHSTAEIVQLAQHKGATKLLAAHNHPGTAGPTPSDADVNWAASLHDMASRAGMELADDFVVCTRQGKRELKSVLRTQRFRDRMRRY